MPQNEGYEAIQILTTFFKTYTASSLENLENFELALEMFFNIIFAFDKEGLEFDPRYVFYYKSSTTSIMKTSLKLLTYSFNKDKNNILELFNSTKVLGPQERFFLFICNSLKYYQQDLLPIFEKILSTFDFIKEFRLKREAFNILYQELEKVEGIIDEENQKKSTKVIQEFLIKLKSIVAKISETFGELSADERSLCRNSLELMISNIKEMKSESNTYLKNLQIYKLVIDKTGTYPEHADNEDGENDFTGLSGSSLLQKEKHLKVPSSRAAKRTKNQNAEGAEEEKGLEDDVEDDENDTVEKQNEKSTNQQKKRVKKQKNPIDSKKNLPQTEKVVKPKRRAHTQQVSILNQEVNLEDLLEEESNTNENYIEEMKNEPVTKTSSKRDTKPSKTNAQKRPTPLKGKRNLEESKGKTSASKIAVKDHEK